MTYRQALSYMEHKTINRGIAAALFLVAQALYLLTMAPTLSFWDCGEFIATAYTLGVPHPPGAPLFLLIGRLFSMLPFFNDIGARVNLFSTLSAAATVTLTYLITVRLIALYRKTKPEAWSTAEKISAYGGAVAGALVLAFSDSFWFNAVETEVYAPSLFFTAMVVWFGLRWYEEDPDPGSERWLMAAMYMIGLSIGVHLLSLLAIFAVAMLYYFKKYDFSPLSFVLMLGASAAAFLLVYIGIIKGLPVLMQYASWWGFALPLLAVMLVVRYAHVHRRRLLHTVAMSLLLLVVGYTSYALIYVRAKAAPAINENNPSTGEAFFSYLNREQYGDFPLWPRRWSSEPVHQYFYRQYASDTDYFLRYQMNHMYLRYFGWQFIGRGGDTEGAGVDWSQLWGLPFLIGLFGVFSHFRRDWKTASVITMLFLVTGAALVVYLNQTEPQPRERDYSYTGSFFAFALWIGIGVEALLTRAVPAVRNARSASVFSAVLLGGLLFVTGGRMLLANYHTHDRSGNYVPWDWAWNMLQSCDRDAILFTNGDNDTFPLWYLQEVEGIRTDVRVVNLSLANTGWYLLQLKNTAPHGARPLSFSLSDGELADIGYVAIEPVEVDLPATGLRETFAAEYREAGLPVPDALLDTIRWQIRPTVNFRGQGFLRPQDLAVYEILMNNFTSRPVYFALTVGRDNLLGLDDYLRLDGLAYRVVPEKNTGQAERIEPSRLWTNLCSVFRYRNLDDPDVYIEDTARRLSGNYKPLFARLALELAARPDDQLAVRDSAGNRREAPGKTLAIEALDRSGSALPLERFGIDPEVAASVVSLYVELGKKDKADPYIAYLEKLAAVSTIRSAPRVHYALALALREVGRTGEAKKIMDELLREIDQESPQQLKEK